MPPVKGETAKTVKAKQLPTIFPFPSTTIPPFIDSQLKLVKVNKTKGNTKQQPCYAVRTRIWVCYAVLCKHLLNAVSSPSTSSTSKPANVNLS